ncbi:hypothetical protein 44RRORF236c [Aeromonas phage 44RR2.8t]|uniref:Uncharacterized protein n=2 Tax=Biquartavirus 44RR2 TaxID=115987 RepID=Q6U966_9CAUD|nr:goF mRNA metabolism modulator [Aeromonas phage 44RR2.8t]AAQ81554.1 hypothetical protein 44RRORF236c [Aeromonas phage 44RR2.8t]APU00708.1 hypothetical protein [Aeromonas phage 44RR2.8t.2]
MKIQFKSEQAFNEYCDQGGLYPGNAKIVDFMPDGWDSIIIVDRIDVIIHEDNFFWDIAVDPADGMALHTIAYDEVHLFNIIEK